MKKTLFTTILLGMTFSGVSVFADNDVAVPVTPIISTISVVSEKEEVIITKKHQKITSRADNLINERINKLNSNINTINADKSLTTEQKASLNNIATTNIAGLTTLQASIASSTNATTTKNLVSSIFTQFRIYGIVIPQIRLEKRIIDLQNHAAKLSDTFLKVQTIIDEAKGKGKDVTVWQKSLDDTKLLVANDMNTLVTLFAKVSALKPSDYGTSSKTTIEQVNAGIKTVLKDFNSVRKSIQKPTGFGNTSRKVVGDSERKSSPLSGTSWTWVSSTVGGVATLAPVGGKFILSFGEDNRVHSTTDCNGMNGSYSIGDGNIMTFSQFATTMMYCEGSQESLYGAQLTKTVKYTVEGLNLMLTNASGTMIFVKK